MTKVSGKILVVNKRNIEKELCAQRRITKVNIIMPSNNVYTHTRIIILSFESQKIVFCTASKSIIVKVITTASIDVLVKNMSPAAFDKVLTLSHFCGKHQANDEIIDMI